MILSFFKRIFESSNCKTYDLGKLQTHGFVETIDDLSACPNCNSKNIAWKFFIPVNGSEPTTPPQDICNHCGYKDIKGEFMKTNMSIYRDKKINQILDGIQ